MEENNEYIKLPLEERCTHKLWKARVHGYEEAAKLFHQLDEKAPEFSKFLGLVKKFVVDSNAAAQEKGLEAVLAFVENSAVAGKTVGEVMSGIVSKCIAAPKAKTKELSVQITLTYVEIERHDAVLEELLKGMEHKNPKIVAACVAAVALALKEFGPKIINIKPLVKKVPVLLEDRDKVVRDEGKLLAIEMYRWIGAALQPQMKDLKPVQVTELETEFAKAKGGKAVPTRYIRSQQQKQAKLIENLGSGEGDGDPNECEAQEEVDPYELLEPVDILSKLSKDFYEKVEAKKWQERKEAMDNLEELLQAPKLETGDYGDVIRALRKIITKDSNVMVIAVAAKNLAALANGLKKRFQPYATACIPAVLEKFREKKQNVVSALRDAADAIFISTNVEAIQEDVLAALENKNPSVKSETASFLARCFTKCTPAMLNKKLLKVYTASLIKLLNDPDPVCRDNSAEALGTAMKVVSEKTIMPFMSDVEPIKMTKIRECCEKAVIVAKMPKNADRPNTAPAKLARGDMDGMPAPPTKPTAVAAARRPQTSASNAKRPAAKKPTAGGGSAGAAAKSSAKVEREMTADEVDEKAVDIFSEEVLSGLVDANWKTRLSAVEQFMQVMQEMDSADLPSQLLIRVLNKKPGLKDTNFQVLKARLEALKALADTTQLSSTCIDACVVDVADKLGDVKNGALAAEVLTSLSEASKLDLVGTSVVEYAFNQKNPKVQQEALNWLAGAIREFGFVINPKSIMESVKKAIAATHPGVRTAGIQFSGTLYVYMGPQLSIFFDNEKPVLKQQLQAEFDKHVGETVPVPTRGARRQPNTQDDDAAGEEDNAESNLNIHELMPRVDINSQITESLLNELKDKNWKVRNEALQKLENILKDNRYITNNLGELPHILGQRLLDSNSNIAKNAIGVCQTLGTAMGSQCKVHVPFVFPALLQSLGDNKQWIRSAAISCINTWGDQCGYKEFFKSEMIPEALKGDSPTLRAELWAWLTEKLPDLPPKSVPKEELLSCLPYLFSNVEDRNADVRKNAQESVLAFMLHLNYLPMQKAAEKLKPGSRNVVMGLLEKVRGNMPVRPIASAKGPACDEEVAKTVKTAGAKAAATAAAPAANARLGAKGKAANAVKPGGRKKDDDADTSPLLLTNSLKTQRSIDEHKLKVLKWNFTSPREEFVDLLREQMSTAGVNKSLIANMFHSDFRYHLKAIETLNEDLPLNASATVANLDLILKWMTLRFFDTNPSVLIKGLEYLQTVFGMLIEEGYNMFEHEAASFIPYLILKIGDPKDAVRNSVRGLFRQMECVYPLSKLFPYIMEGLKSKNARQRTECLDLLSSLIEAYGLIVCNPSPAAALKEIAKQISDRDNSVRNAALNCVVQAFFLEGEKVYKMVGQISDKDLSLLEERIKRAAKNRPPPGSRPPPGRSALQPQAPQQVVLAPTKEECEESEAVLQKESPELEEVPPQPVMRNAVPKSRPVSGPFGLDEKLLEKIEAERICRPAPKLQNFDLEMFESPVNIPKTGFTAQSNPSPDILSGRVRQLDACTTVEQVLDLGISNMASADFSVAWTANVQMEGLLSSDKASRLAGKEDSLMRSVSTQLKVLHANGTQGIPIQSLEKGYRTLLMVIMEFFDHKNLCCKVWKDVLADLVQELLILLVEGQLEDLADGNAYTRVLNMLMVRIIERAHHTNITRAFLQLLHSCCANNNSFPQRFEELTMKCLWRVIKLMPSWDDVDIPMILHDLHIFLRDYPPPLWKKRESDTPIRTVKTILHTITKLVGGDRILQYASQLENLNDSELQPYLVKLVKKIKIEETKTKKSPHRLSKVTHEQLSEIFKKIGSKDETKEGLELLYDFREQHPEADIEPFLKKSSQFFQDYIQKGLRTVHAERLRSDDQGCPTLKTLSTTTSMSSLGLQGSGGPGTPFSEGGDLMVGITEQLRNLRTHGGDRDDHPPESKNAVYYLERLRALQARAGLDPACVPLDTLKGTEAQRQLNPLEDNGSSDENLNKGIPHDTSLEFQSVSQNTSSNSGGSCSPASIEDIRKRLEAFKNAKR